MTVTIHSPFHGPPTISREGFIAVLERTGSFDSEPLWGPFPRNARPDVAYQCYDIIANAGHDPAVHLAILGKESSFGTNQNSVLWRNNTRSYSNARTIRHPDVLGEIITDSYRRSNYVRYQDIRDSFRDGVYRVDEEGFAYRQANANTIAEVIAIWAPADDANDPSGYSRTMVDWMNQWAAEFPVEQEPPMAAQIPGFTWRPARSSHFRRGRTQQVRGYAQHYTAGTNSLGWLTGDSSPPVSSTFLIKHNPTLADRGWQLVRIEDTAWTTANANPYTVSCEYEHNQQRPVPDIAYTVMAQTIIDTAKYVKDKGLGEIPLTRQGIRGHKEWVNNPSLICPDGINVNRLVDEVQKLAKPEPEPDDPCRYFEATGHYICHGFRGFWEDNGGLAIFGYPLSTEFDHEDGFTVQWFERARFEHQPNIAGNKHGVVLGRVGAESRKVDEEKYPDAFERQEPPS